MEAKRALMIAKLEQRHKKPFPSEQNTNGTKDSDNDLILQSGVDSMTNFQHQFYGERTLIEKEMDHLKTISNGSSLLDNFDEKKFDEISGRLLKLQSHLNEATSILSAYEIRRGNASIQELQDRLKQLRLASRPKKRFAFTNLKSIPSSTTTTTQSTVSSNGGLDTIDGTTIADEAALNSAAIVVKNRENENLNVSKEDSQSKDVLLFECRSCTISLLGISTTVHAKGLVDCIVISYPVLTSIFIENCERTTFVMACQQLRMHSSQDCDLYLHVTTKAIIEDCQRLRFAPYVDSIKGLDMDQVFEESNLDRSLNYWNQVQDFHWLVFDKPSPNWCILPIDERRIFCINS